MSGYIEKYVDGSYTHTLKIPESWVFVELYEAINIIGGSQPPKSEFHSEFKEGLIRLIQIRDYKSDAHKVYIPLEKAKRFVSTDDVMIGRYGPPIFQILRGLEGAYNVALMKAVPIQGVLDNKYLFHFLNNRDIYNYVDSASDRTAGQSGVNKSHLEKYPVGIPPLAEQKIIADKLDELLAQVESTKARLDAIPAILKSFRQSVLAAAVSGKLTKEWRGDCTSNQDVIAGILFEADDKKNVIQSWKWRKLTDIARLESGHTPRKSIPEYWEGGDVPWISLQDIRAAHGKVISKTKFMPTAQGIANSSARLLPAGTVCFCRDISVGYTTVMGMEMSTTQHFANWVCGSEVNNLYMLYAFMASKDHLTRSGQGTTVKTIYMPALKELQILLPPTEEQAEIVRRVEELFAFADKVEAQVNTAQARVNNLTQSILAKAFRGELTAEWRAANPDLISGENSAEALLERIEAERVKLSTKSKPRKPKTKVKANEG